MASSRVQYAGEKYETMEQQSEFEKNLFGKTKNTHARTEGARLLQLPRSLALCLTASFRVAEITLLNKQIVVYMFSTDVYLYVAGDHNENELILATMLGALYDTLDTMLRCGQRFAKRAVTRISNTRCRLA
jgi:hypothetical protein